MATYETNAKAQQDLVQKLYKASSELKPIYDSKEPKEAKRAEELKTEIGKIQNQLMMSQSGISGGVGAFGGGIAKGVTSLFTAIPDLAIMGYDYLRSPNLSELVTGKQPTKTASEWLTPGIESTSQENAGLFGAGKGIGSSLGFGPKMTAANIGANWFDEYMAKGNPLAQTALAVGSVAELGRRGLYSFLQSRNAKKLLETMPKEDISLLKDYVLKGQTSTDPLIAGKIAKLRANPEYADIFNTLQVKAGEKILAGVRQETNPNYPTSGAGKDIFNSVDFQVTDYKDKIKTVAENLYKKAAKLSGDTPMVNTTKTQEAIAAQIKNLEKSPLNDSEAAVKFLQKLQTELTENPKMTVPQLQTWLTDFGRKARGNEALVTDVSVGTQQRMSSAIFGGLKDDLALMGKSADKTEQAVSNLLQTASAKTKGAVDKYETFIADGLPNAFRGKVISQMNTEDVLNTISNIKDPTVKAKTLALIKSTEPDAFRLVQQRTFDDFVKGSRTAVGEATGKIDLKSVAERWNGLNAAERDNLALAMGTTSKEFGERMNEVDKFFRYGQKFAGEQAASQINPAAASNIGYALSGGQYIGGKLGGMIASTWNTVKGGLSDEQTLSLLLSPETKNILGGIATNPNNVQNLERLGGVLTNPNSVKTFKNIDKALATDLTTPAIAAVREGTMAAENKLTRPAAVTPNPITSFGGVDFSAPEEGSPTQEKTTKPFGGVDFSAPAGSLDVSFNSLSKDQQDRLLQAQFGSEGNKPGNLAYDLNNPGAMVYVGGWQDQFGAKPGRTVTGPDGKTRTFAAFPDQATGMEAQRSLWSKQYGDVPLEQALSKWVDPHDSKQFTNYKNTILASLD